MADRSARMVRNRSPQTPKLISSSVPLILRISVLWLHHQASPCDRPTRPDILRHVLQAANTGYGRLSILTVPRSRDRHLRRLDVNPALMIIEPNIVCTRQRRRKSGNHKHDYCAALHWSRIRRRLGPFDEVPRHDERRFASTTDEAGDGSSGSGRLLLWECDATACGVEK
jgi:hypothetical protein